MTKEKTIYCGSGKKMNESWLKVSINFDKIKDFVEEYKGNKFIKLNVNLKAERDEYGKDVSLSVDTWKPDENTTPKKKEAEEKLPF